MKIYATSDTHFGHTALYEKYGRPADFEARLINSLRRISGDLLIHAGDFCIGNDEQWHVDFMRITANMARKVLVRGNHDPKSDAWYLDHGWDFVCESFSARMFGKNIIFSHKPVNIESGTEFDLNVHGHYHGGGINSHRYRGGLYDPTFHRDLAPELHEYAPVMLERFIHKNEGV